MSQTRTRLGKEGSRLGSARTRLFRARYITSMNLQCITVTTTTRTIFKLINRDARGDKHCFKDNAWSAGFDAHNKENTAYLYTLDNPKSSN